MPLNPGRPVWVVLRRRLLANSTNSAHAIAVTRSASEFCDCFEVQSGPKRMNRCNDCFDWQQSLALLS